MKDIFADLKKILLFGFFGAVGCAIAALAGEILLKQTLTSLPLTSTSVDIIFVLDVTSSMQEEIDGVRNGIQDFVGKLKNRNIDARVGLVAFRDRWAGEEPQILSFGDGIFTNDITGFQQAVGQLQALGGGDSPESSLDAVVLAARQPFRAGANKVMILITDAPPKVPDRETPTIQQAAGILRQNNLNQLHLVIPDEYNGIFSGLRDGVGGENFSLAEAAREREKFDRVLPVIGEAIGKGLMTRTAVDTKGSWPLPIVTGLWTGLLAIGASLALIIGQNHYLRRRILNLSQGAAGLLGGLLAGFLAGAAGAWFFKPFDNSILESVGRIIAWAVLGVLVGWGLAFYVPNLKPARARLGGGIGGALGAIGFLLANGAFQEDMAGRLIGAAILGFFIGVMIALVEAAFREAWLEITYGPKEIRRVSLGPEPVSIGSDPHCTIYARNAPAVAYRFKLEQGQIRCENLATGATGNVQPGSSRNVGNLLIAVRAAGTTLPLPSAKPAAKLTAIFSLQIGNRAIPLPHGTRLTKQDIPGLAAKSSDGIVAEVSHHPKDPTALGLKNLSDRTWQATLADGSSRTIDPGRSIKLAAGTKINFGSAQGEIQS